MMWLRDGSGCQNIHRVSKGREDGVTHLAGRTVMKGIVGNCLCSAEVHWIYTFPLTYVHAFRHFQWIVLAHGRDTTATIQIIWGN